MEFVIGVVRLYDRANEKRFNDEADLLTKLYELMTAGESFDLHYARFPLSEHNKYCKWYTSLELEEWTERSDVFENVRHSLRLAIDGSGDFATLMNIDLTNTEEGSLEGCERKVDRLRKQMKELQLEIVELKKFKKRVVSAIENEE